MKLSVRSVQWMLAAFACGAASAIGADQPQPAARGVQPQVRGVQPQVRGVQPQVGGVQPQVGGVQPQVRGVQPQVQGVQPQVQGVQPQVRGQQSLGAPGTGTQDVFRDPPAPAAAAPAPGASGDAQALTPAVIEAGGGTVPRVHGAMRPRRFGLGHSAFGVAAESGESLGGVTGAWSGPVLVTPARRSLFDGGESVLIPGTRGELVPTGIVPERGGPPAGAPTDARLAALSPEQTVLNLVWNGEAAAARDAADSILAATPDEPAVLRARALAWAMDGRLDHAWPQVLQAYTLDPGLAERPVPAGFLPEPRAGEITSRAVSLASGRPEAGRVLLAMALLQYADQTSAAARLLPRARAAGVPGPVVEAFERSLMATPLPLPVPSVSP